MTDEELLAKHSSKPAAPASHGFSDADLTKQPNVGAASLSSEPNYGTQESPGPDLPPDVAEKRAGLVQPARAPATDDNFNQQELFEQREKLKKGTPEYDELTKRIARGQTNRVEEAADYTPVGRIGKGVAGVAEKGFKAGAEAAHKAGFVLTPEMISNTPGAVASGLSGWSGKAKLQQLASVRNEATATRLATSDLGLPLNAPLNDATFASVRKEAGKSYADISLAMPKLKLDDAFLDDMVKLKNRDPQAAEIWPEIVKNPKVDELVDALVKQGEVPTPAAMFLVRDLRSKGIANLKVVNNPELNELGLVQRRAADAIDDVIERRLAEEGYPNLSSAYKEARTRIAKSYDVEAATDPGTRQVNPQKLAVLKNKGRPLSGNLDIIADAANSFWPAFQNPAKFGGVGDYSVMDFFGAAVAAMHGDLPVVAGIAGRPGARGAVLSEGFQKRMFSPPSPSGQPRIYPNVTLPVGQDDPGPPLASTTLGIRDQNPFGGKQ